MATKIVFGNRTRDSIAGRSRFGDRYQDPVRLTKLYQKVERPEIVVPYTKVTVMRDE